MPSKLNAANLSNPYGRQGSLAAATNKKFSAIVCGRIEIVEHSCISQLLFLGCGVQEQQIGGELVWSSGTSELWNPLSFTSFALIHLKLTTMSADLSKRLPG